MAIRSAAMAFPIFGKSVSFVGILCMDQIYMAVILVELEQSKACLLNGHNPSIPVNGYETLADCF